MLETRVHGIAVLQMRSAQPDPKLVQRVVAALKNGGLAKSPTFGTASGWLANADADSIDSIARKIEALAAAGMPGAAQTEADRLYALRSLGASATWGGLREQRC